MKSIKKILNKIVVSLIILFMAMQYMPSLIYAKLSDSQFSSLEFPFNMKEITFQKVAVGDSGGAPFLGIDTNGNLWAKETDNSGCLGIGPYVTSINYSIKQVKKGTKFKEISIGFAHSLAIDINGNLWSTGTNTYGQLGNGNTTNTTEFVQIKIGTTFSKIHTYGNYSMAIDTNGNLYFWGMDSASENIYNSPQQVMNGTKFKDITQIGSTFCALTESGKIYVWGKIQTTSEEINYTSPKAIATSYTFKKISGGLNHILAIDLNNKLYAWGNNSYGQIGNGNNTYSDEPINIKSDTYFKEISTGRNTSYAIDISGDLWGWGDNGIYQLGDGTTTNSNIPKKIKEDKKFTYLSEGVTAKYALDSEGILWGWSNYCTWHTTEGWSTGYTPIQITAFYYDVNFYDEDGTTKLDTKSVISGSSATTTVEPTKQSNAQYNYTFEKWVAMDGNNIDLSSITQDTNVKAKYKENLRSYKVTFKNYDGTILQEKDVNYGETATYTGIVPTKNIDGYTVTLSGWSPNLNNTIITEDTIFTAQYEAKINNYNIIYNDTEGAQFEQENPKTYTIETDSFTLSNPSKAGYTFERLGRNWNNKRYKNSNNK